MPLSNLSPMDYIESKRTILRRLSPTDLENMARLESNPLIMQFTPSRIPQTLEQTKLRLQGQVERQKNLSPFGIWAADLKADSSFLGWFMLLPSEENCLELGFMLIQEQWNKGFATEVGQVLINFARTYPKISKITAKTNIENVASIRTLEKLGFKYIETLSVPEKVLGGHSSIKIFDLSLHK
jgi:ribosomal-protein-alanine N-acetyltransferase